MSAPKVDVLAVLDALANYASTHGAPDRHAPMLREARAAVAELIEATKTILDPHTPVSVNMQYDNLRAALARIGAQS